MIDHLLPPGTRHTIPGIVGGNAIWFDYNNDGRLDVLIAGMSAEGPVSGIYRNDNASFTEEANTRKSALLHHLMKGINLCCRDPVF